MSEFGAFKFFALSAFLVVGPIVARDDLGGAAVWAAVLIADGAGALIGGVLALRIRPTRPLASGSMALFAFVPTLVLLAVAAPLWLVALAALAGGTGVTFVDTLWYTELQTQVPPKLLSRVSSFDYLGSKILAPLGLSAAGAGVALIGADATLLVAAVAFTAISLVLIRAIRIREPAAAPAYSASRH